MYRYRYNWFFKQSGRQVRGYAMEKILRRSISVLMIMLMIIPYTWLAYAEDTLSETTESEPAQNEEVQPAEAAQPTPAPVTEPEPAAVPEPAPAAETEPAPAPEPEPSPVSEPEPAPAPESEPEAAPAAVSKEPAPEPAGTSEEPAAVAEESDQTVTGPSEVSAEKDAAAEQYAAEPEPEETAAEPEPADEEAAAEPESAGQENAPALRAIRSVRKAPEKSITIGGSVLDCSSAGSGNGWSYDSSSNTITLKDFSNKADIVTSQTGVTIVTTGLNRIGTLSCDGQIDVIGTGILLIDKIELAEGCDFNLHSLKEWYGEDGGSAAIFLRQDDGSYKLMNGSVTGVIDEEIALPEGTTLVLPEYSKLKVTGMYIGVKYDEDHNPTYCYREMISGTPMDPEVDPENITYLAGAITVDNLVLNRNASISQVEAALIKGLHVLKSLVNNGTIRGNTVTIDGGYSGSGTLEKAKVYVNKGQELSISVKDSSVNLNGKYVINSITSSGKSELYYDNKSGETIIRNIKMAAGDRLDIFGKEDFAKGKKLKLTGSLDGGNVFLWSGITDIESQFKTLNGGKFHFASEGKMIGATVFDYSGTGTLSTGIGGPVFMGPAGFGTVPDQTKVPVEAFHLEEYEYLDGHIELKENDDYDEVYTSIEPFDVSGTLTEGIITLDDLNDYFVKSAYFKKMPYGYEVIRYSGGILSMSVLGADYDYSCPDDNVVLIRVIVDYKVEHQPLGGSPETTTLSSRTGAGVIGGNPNSIMIGTGIRRSSDKNGESGEKEIAEPVNINKNKSGSGKANKTDADADKSGKDNENPDDEDYTNSGTAKRGKLITFATAEGNTLTYQIEEFDLNEGKEDAEKAIYYTLTAFLNGSIISELERSIEVTMDYELPEEFKDKPLYAVFVNEDEASGETLSAVRAEYIEETGQLTFETAQLGDFVIAALEFEGEEFSPEFYDELEKVPEVQPLIELIKEKTGQETTGE